MGTSRSLFWSEGEGTLARALARVAATPAPKPAAAPVQVPVEMALPAPLPAPARREGATMAGFTPPYGSLEDRIEAWLQWIAGRAGAPHAFLLDRDGLPMLQLGGDSRVVELASLARGLLGRLAEAAAGRGRLAVSVRLESERLLRLIDVTTPLGPLTVGFVQRDAGAADFEAGLRGSLARCFVTEVGASPPAGP